MFYSYLNLNPFKTAVPLTAAFFEFVLCIILDMYLYFLKSIFHEIDFWTWFLQASTQAVKIKFEIDKKSSSKINFVK